MVASVAASWLLGGPLVALLLVLQLALADDVTVAATAPQAQSALQAPAEELWAGRVTLWGQRRYPFVGQVDIRSDNFLLARVRRIGDAYHLEQEVCSVDIAKAAGGKVWFHEAAYKAMPVASFRFLSEGDGRYAAPSWVSGWDGTDYDKDGRPGITVNVDVPLCGGKLFMSNVATNTATGTMRDGGGLVGSVTSHLDQKTIEAEGVCLSIVSKNHADTQAGVFTYVPVPRGTTCATVPQSAWPEPSRP